jgi:superfamily I DNA/RNA helicase
MYFLGGTVPLRARRSSALNQMTIAVENSQAIVRYRDGSRRPVRELLVDESQDAPPEVLSTLDSMIDAGFTRVVLSADTDQAIHRANHRHVLSTLQRCKAAYEMAYCYRSTRQIMTVARSWLASFGATAASASVFGLSGPRVRFVPCDGLRAQVEESVQVLEDLQLRFPHESLALVYCQYFNPSFSGTSPEEKALKEDRRTMRFYRFASLTKGKEYLAGILFVSDSFMARHVSDEGRRLRRNTMYVALTRFRDEVTIVYPRGCHIEPQLEAISRELRAPGA